MKNILNKSLIRVSLDEINATIKNVKKPLIRKTYLGARRWYMLHKEKLISMKYKGKIPKFPKHNVKTEGKE